MSSSGQLVALSNWESGQLLRSVPVGRLVFTEGALPAVRPVNFAVDSEGDVVIWSTPGAKAEAVCGQVVAFEVDEIDARSRTGWSVVVLGRAEPVTDVDELVALADPTTRPWVAGRFDRAIRIRVEQITGRRLDLVREP